MSILSVVLVLSAGFCLYFARPGLVRTLDATVPTVELPSSTEGGDTSAAVAEDPAVPTAEPVLNLECSEKDLEAAARPLLAETEQLIAAARSEIGEFKGMSGKGGAAAARRNRWSKWVVVWRNRVARIRGALPPRGICAKLEDLAPACDVVDSAMFLLERVPFSQSVSEAAEILDQAQGMIEEFRQLQDEAAELARMAAEAAVGAVGDQPASVPP